LLFFSLFDNTADGLDHTVISLGLGGPFGKAIVAESGISTAVPDLKNLHWKVSDLHGDPPECLKSIGTLK
jgi:hypothetical protein